MRIISWNTRGLKKPQVTQEIKILTRKYHPDIVFLLETMVNEQNLLRIVPSLGFDHFDYVLPTSHSGGIVVLWNNENVHISVLHKHPRAIHMLIHDPTIAKTTVVSGIYAPAQSAQKHQFWAHLKELNAVMDSPWCLIGDFNELENCNEKSGGLAPALSRFSRLNNFLSEIDAASVQVNGCQFTWKRRSQNHLIYERLDRAIARIDWGQIYPEAYLTHGCFSCSDHYPILLSTRVGVEQRKASPFRYQNFWAQYQKSTELIRKAWRRPVTGTRMFQMVKKLRAVKFDLRIWAKQHFGNFHLKTTNNEEKIRYVESRLVRNPTSFRLNSWLVRLLKQREKLLLFNQKYWGKFRRKAWLTGGDRNSKYFQRIADTHRCRKRVVRIKDDCGLWIGKQARIADKFIADYKLRYKSEFLAKRSLPKLGLAKGVTHAIT